MSNKALNINNDNVIQLNKSESKKSANKTKIKSKNKTKTKNKPKNKNLKSTTKIVKKTTTLIQPSCDNVDNNKLTAINKPPKIYKINSGIGRPTKYQSVEQLDLKIQEFLQFCKDNNKPLTVERLLVTMDIDYDILRDYAYIPEFSSSIKRIRNIIVADKVERLNECKGNVAGIIFDLKNNHGWTDKQEIHSVNVNVNADVSNMSNDEIQKELDNIELQLKTKTTK